ncbi:hypothetical protein PGTUg99_026893 [Puccinia graminis f. sp. tritici]|uniref:Tet-like 2OG-Fe(II) oxygenase domain-containing protein n=1 Tax=Puccinia graminis f. sp. tritici TaxID=56615 RepID=A0A5B0RN79_PUCGR|nr:hypothetical protein PGTUg99_026893 [Puccinia graminis f. sp. tritici]
MTISKSVRPKNAMKARACQKKRSDSRTSQVSLDIHSSGFKGEKVIWSLREYRKLHLYPKIHAEKKKPSQKPTDEELRKANKIVDKFHPFHHGKVIVRDTSNHGEVVAVIQFTPINELSAIEREEINFVTTFLHQSKKFVNPTGPSRTWGGRMWGIGWRKCMKALELFGRYIKLRVARQSRTEYFALAMKSFRVSNILGRMFKNFANIPFKSNRDLMETNGIPSFASAKFNDSLSKLDCAPHITFTSNGFFNPPHFDKGDTSEYAFVLFVPTNSSDGTLADPSSGYNVSGGRFVFPDYRFYIDFKQKGIVKLLWPAKNVKHCTLPAVKPKGFRRMAMSLQITKKALNTCRDIKNELHGDEVESYLNCSSPG